MIFYSFRYHKLLKPNISISFSFNTSSLRDQVERYEEIHLYKKLYVCVCADVNYCDRTRWCINI